MGVEHTSYQYKNLLHPLQPLKFYQSNSKKHLPHTEKINYEPQSINLLSKCLPRTTPALAHPALVPHAPPAAAHAVPIALVDLYVSLKLFFSKSSPLAQVSFYPCILSFFFHQTNAVPLLTWLQEAVNLYLVISEADDGRVEEYLRSVRV